MQNIKKVCVFCASSPAVDEVYFRDTIHLGRILLENKIHVVYGGGGVGLMGCLADTMLEGGGKITGIIPGFMKRMEWAHKGVKDMIEVDTMHQRKSQMIMGTDAVIALPGGVGTLEELTEVITLKQLGQYFSPVVIINTAGFYNHLQEFLHKMIEESFMRHLHREIWQMVDSPDSVMDAITQAPPWDGTALKYAAVDPN